MQALSRYFVILLLVFVVIQANTAMSTKKSINSPATKRLRRYFQNEIKIYKNSRIVAQSNPPDLSTNSRVKARNLLLLCSVIYSLSYIFTKKLLHVYSIEWVNIVRFGLGAIALFPAILGGKFERSVLLAGLELGLWCSIGYLAQAKTIRQESTSKAALFSTIAVVIPPLLDGISKSRFRVEKTEKQRDKGLFQRFRSSKLFPALLAFIGAVVVECGDLKLPTLSDSYLFVPPVAFAMCFWRSEQFHQKYHFAPEALTAYMVLFTFLFLTIYSLYYRLISFHTSSLHHITFSRVGILQMVLLMFNGFLATAFNSVAEQKALQTVSAADLSLTYAVEPIFTGLLSFLLLSESMSWNLVIGSLFIVLAAISGTL